MGRANKPWFREGKGTWYATVEGRMKSLGVKGKANEVDAVKVWHRLMAGVMEKATPKAKPEPTVSEVVKGFLADVEARAKPNTVRLYRLFLNPFAKRFGALKCSELSPPVAESYARKPGWCDTSRNAFLGALATAFRWAERARLINRTPLVGLKRPPKASRGAEAVIGKDEHARLLEAAGKCFKPFLRLLHLTGARPGEVAAITAENFDVEGAMVRLKEHKTAHKGKSRTIYLCTEAVAVLLEQKALYGEGVLLRNTLGKPWAGKAVVKAMIAVRLRAGIEKAIAYGYRHTFATDALANGVPDAQVAELLGHSGTAMLHKHYSHLTGQARVLRDALGKVR
jgi:integrase/recombinase XerC